MIAVRPNRYGCAIIFGGELNMSSFGNKLLINGGMQPFLLGPKKLNLLYTGGIPPKRITSVGAHGHGFASGQHDFEVRRKVAAVASR